MIARFSLGALALAVCLGFVSPAGAQVAPEPEGAPPDMAELMKAPSFGDAWLGKEDAPVTVIEYASLTCPHCAKFYGSVMRPFKEQFIDTGKVRFIYRPFPLNAIDLGAYTIAQCRGKDAFLPMVDLLFARQEKWAFVEKPFDALLATVKEAGFTQDSAVACLKNTAISDGLKATGDHAEEKLGVTGTPTFFINGKRYVGELNLAEISAIVTPLIKN